MNNELLIQLLVAITNPQFDPTDAYEEENIVKVRDGDGTLYSLGSVWDLIEVARKQSLELRKLKQLSEHDF